jgi:hypothetical protein
VSPVKISSLLLLTVILAVAVIAAGCTGAGSGTAPGTTTAGTLPAASGDAVLLTVTGSVEYQLQLTSSDLATFPAVPVNLSDMRTNRNDHQSAGPATVVTDGNGGNMPAGTNGGLPSGVNGGYQAGTDGTRVVIGPGGNLSGNFSNGMLPGDMNAMGLALNALLDAAGPIAGATNVTFLGMDGRVLVVPLSEIRASAGAAIVTMGPGMLVAFVPGTSGQYTQPGLTGIIVS